MQWKENSKMYLKEESVTSDISFQNEGSKM